MIDHILVAFRRLKQYRRLCFSLFLLKLGLALVIALPALILIQADLDYSSFGRAVLDSWSVDVITELVLTKKNVLSAGVAVLAVFSILVFLVRQFVNGGIYRTVWSRRPLQPGQFFGWSAQHFVDHLVISMGMLLVYALLLLVGSALSSFVAFLVRQLNTGIPFFGTSSRVATVYLVMSVGVAYSDTVRLRKSARPEEPLGKSFKEAFSFFRWHGVQLVGIYLAFLLPFAAVWLAFEGLALVVTGGLDNMLGVVLELLFFQTCALLRTAQGLLGIAGMSALIQSKSELAATPIPHEATVD